MQIYRTHEFEKNTPRQIIGQAMEQRFKRRKIPTHEVRIKLKRHSIAEVKTLPDLRKRL
jgi:hypothetical protein